MKLNDFNQRIASARIAGAVKKEVMSKLASERVFAETLVEAIPVYRVVLS